jgi:hypothetical protein
MAASQSPGFGTTLGAAYNAATDSTLFVQQMRKRDAYNALADQLATQTGKDPGNYYVGGQTDTHAVPDLVWRDINARRAADPNFMKDIGANQGEFEKRVLTRGGQYQIDAATAHAGGIVPNLIGAAASAWHDPFQMAAMAVGGPEVTLASRGVIMNGLARAGAAAATNAAVAAAEEPLTIDARSNLGQATTPGDVATDLAGAAVFGGALHGAGEIAGPIARSVVNAGQNALETGLTHAYGALPDSVLADHFAAKTAPYERTPEEQSALYVINRHAEVDATNPFQPSYGSMAVHMARLDEAGAALDNQRMPGGGPAFRPPVNGTVTGDYYAKLGQAENAAGNPNASPGTSSARGLYQFTDGTWLNLYKARFGDGGQSNAQIIALKTNADLQNTLVRDLTQQNADYLRRQNIPADDANLYLAHFAGPDDAVKLIEADPRTSVEAVMHAKSIEANKWLKGKTAGEVRAWAERKMGGAGLETAAPEAAVPRDDGAGASADADDMAMDGDEMTPADQPLPPGPDGGPDIATRVDLTPREDAAEPVTPLDPEALRPTAVETPHPDATASFADAHDQMMQQQADSAWHDLLMAEQAREAAGLPPRMFDLGDGPVSARAIHERLGDDEKALNAVASCLTPPAA